MLNRIALVVTMALGLGACTMQDAGQEPATRAAPLDAPVTAAPAKPAPVEMISITPDWRISQINVTVPKNLRVSEANTYYPSADIVWRGDTLGDRYKQIEAIFTTAAQQSARALKGKDAVILDIELIRFHSVTERTRYSIGGVHDMNFYVTVRDARNGTILVDKRRVDTELNAYGGLAAIAAEQAGRGQKVRILEHLTSVIYKEMQAPIEMPATLVAAR